MTIPLLNNEKERIDRITFSKRMLFLLLFLFISFIKQPAYANNIYSKEDLPKYKKYKYILTCVSNQNNSSVFIAPDKMKPFLKNNKNVSFIKGTDIIVDQIINKDSQQFLSGVILTYVANSKVLKNARAENDYAREEDKLRLYVLSEEWRCSLD